MISQPAVVAAMTTPLRPAAPGTLDRLSPDGQVQPAQVGAPVAAFNGDIVDEWGRQSFPASGPPANW